VVIAVTAIDARERVWPQASTAAHVRLAAPGVDVWTIDGQGRRYYANGTSIAAAFASAAIAIHPPA
jgi:hypothetical protein